MNLDKRIGVLHGGRGSEREVSLRTGKAVHDALKGGGRDVVLIDVGTDIAVRLRQERVEVAFVALHGRYGEDGCIQGLLESLDIPYTGSGVLASSIAMEKVVTKALLARVGIPTPAGVDVEASRAASLAPQDLPFGLPCVVKPSREGSSVGVTIVHVPAQLPTALADAARYGHRVLVEQYVKGREVQAAVLDDVGLGVIEIEPADEFYSYQAKYAGTGTRYHYPARVPQQVYDRVLDLAVRAHVAIGCAGATRSDLIATDAGEVFLLEVNTLPGMTATSLLPKIAQGNGISFLQLCERLVAGARLKA
jgi:D-alanine-D-alanine ligase